MKTNKIDFSKYSNDALILGKNIFSSNLTIKHISGKKETIYDLGPGLVTLTGVTILAAAFAGTSPGGVSAFNWHDSGTGSAGAATGDVGLSLSAGIPARASGTQTNPAGNQYRTVATQTLTAAVPISEWGLFNDSSKSSSGMWDRKTFSTINAASGDSIQYTYTLTILSGG